jgi:hypothetical protein
MYFLCARCRCPTWNLAVEWRNLWMSTLLKRVTEGSPRTDLRSEEIEPAPGQHCDNKL